MGLSRESKPDKQALISFRKIAGQLVTNLFGETDNIITFPVAVVSSTAVSIMDFDGTVFEVKQRHPAKYSPLGVLLVLTNTHNSGVNVTINLRKSTDGGATYPTIANTETFPMLPKSGATDSSFAIPIGHWLLPKPESVPIFFKVQVFADVTNVVTIEAGSNLNANGVYI